MATPALAFAQLANEFEAEGLTPKNSERIGQELAKTFGVKEDEIGILRLEKQNLMFCYPAKLHNIGSIPLNTTGSVAARTATSRRAEVPLRETWITPRLPPGPTTGADINF